MDSGGVCCYYHCYHLAVVTRRLHSVLRSGSHWDLTILMVSALLCLRDVSSHYCCLHVLARARPQFSISAHLQYSPSYSRENEAQRGRWVIQP